MMHKEHAEANQMLLAHGLEMRQQTPTLYDNVKTMAGTYYGTDDIYSFEHEIRRNILMNPDLTHILYIIGDPGSGKTSFLNELLERQMYAQASFPDLALPDGYSFDVVNLPWGDVFHHIPKDLRVTGVEYHEDENLLAAKQTEVEEANRRYGDTLVQVLQREKTQGAIRIVSADMPAMTGMVTADGEILGIPRCYELLRNLGSASGNFAAFEGEYMVYGVGMIATREVRERSSNVRALMLESQTPEEIEEALWKEGVIFAGAEPDQVMSYRNEVASPHEMTLLEKDVYMFARKLYERGYTVADERFSMIRTDFLESFEIFTANDRQRIGSLGQGVLPKMMEDYGIPSSSAVIVLNDAVLERAQIALGIKAERPLTT